MQVFRDLSLTGGHRAAQEPQAWPWGAWSVARRGWMAWKVSRRRYDFPGYGEWCHPTQVAPMVKNLPANAGDVRDRGPIPGLGRSPGGGHGDPLQCSCLENPMDRGV